MKFNKKCKISIVLLLIALASCNGKSQQKSTDSPSTKKDDVTKSNKIKGSSYSKKAVDSLIHAGLLNPDSIPIAPPTQAEERERLSKTYDDVKIIDSTFTANNDTLHFHLKYYCLKNIDLIEPKLYDPDLKKPKAFITHPFVSHIVLINNRDTVLKKQFKASDFNPFFKDNFGGSLKKYGSIMMPNLSKNNMDKSRIVVHYPITIPATDIGIGVFLIIAKNGSYKVAENY